MNLAPIVKLVRAYDPTEWEVFISEWQKGLGHYKEVKRLGGAGDHGRDVIGLTDAKGCADVWDNYQCKHYEVPLATPKACEDAGKIIFHAYKGEFAPPRRCVFVAPRGPSTELRDLLLNNKFRQEVIKTWNVRVAGRVVAGEKHLLTGALAAYVDQYDFSTFTYATLDEILDAHRKTAYWASRFGGHIPPAPLGAAPPAVAQHETRYVEKLLAVYSEATGSPIASVLGLTDPASQAHLKKQRERFYDAEAFMAHYRDQTEPGTIEDFSEQILDAIEPCLASAGTGAARLAQCLTAAAQAVPASVLTPAAKIRVKQGVCHQLANKDDDRVVWKI